MLLELEKLGVPVPVSTQIAKPATPGTLPPLGSSEAPGPDLSETIKKPATPKQIPGALPPLGSSGAPPSSLDKPVAPAGTAPTAPAKPGWFAGVIDGITGPLKDLENFKPLLETLRGMDPTKVQAIMKALEGMDLAQLAATMKGLEGVDLSKLNFSQLAETMQMFNSLGVDPKELPGLLEKARGAAKYMNADGTPNLGELLSGGLKSVGGLIKDNPLASAAVVGGLGLGAYSLFGNKGNNNNNNNQQTPIQPQVPANQWMANLTKSRGRVDAISPTA